MCGLNTKTLENGIPFQGLAHFDGTITSSPSLHGVPFHSVGIAVTYPCVPHSVDPSILHCTAIIYVYRSVRISVSPVTVLCFF